MLVLHKCEQGALEEGGERWDPGKGLTLEGKEVSEWLREERHTLQRT